MKVFVLVYGSRGDVTPYLALCIALQKAGHEVVLAGPEPFESYVTGYGVKYAPLDPGMLRNFDSKQMRDAVGKNLRGLAAAKALWESSVKASQAIRPVLDAALTAAEGSDVVVHHPFAFAGQHVAEKLGVPAVVGQLNPMFVPTSEIPNTAYHYRMLRRLPGPLNRATYPIFRRMLRSFAGKEVDNWRRALGLPERRHRHDPLRRPDGGPAAVLTPISPHVLRPPRDYPSSVRTTGFWILPPTTDWTPPQELVDFLDAGEPPVYVGFGSLVGSPERAGRIVLDAIRAAGVRAVVAAGRGGLRVVDPPEEVFTLDQAPHDWLLPRMAASVHHGGGTFISAVAAGRPQVICPFMVDQVFWGDRLRRLGVAPTPIPQRKLAVDRLADAIRRAATDPEMARRASELGERVRAEDGATDAVRVVESVRREHELQS